MGRFFRTSQSQLLDFKFKLPEQLLIKAVQFQDQAITNEYALLDQFTRTLKGQGLGAEDQARLDEIFKGFRGKIEDITSRLDKNPLEWRSLMPHLRTLSKDIYTESTEGEWAKIQGNYNAYVQWSKQLDEYVKEHPDKYRPEDIQKLKAFAYTTWGGTKYDPKTGKFSSFSGPAPAEFVNLTELADKLAKGWKADSGKVYKVDKKGDYWVKTVSGWEKVDYNEVFNAVYSTMSNDPRVLSYLRQRYTVDKELGLLSDDDINRMAEPYVKKKVKTKDGKYVEKGFIDKDASTFEKYMMVNLISPTNFAAQKYSYIKSEYGVTDIEADKFALVRERAMWQMRLKMWEKQINNVITTGAKSLKLFDPTKFNAQSVLDEYKSNSQAIQDAQSEIQNLTKLLQDPNLTDEQRVQYETKLLDAKKNLGNLLERQEHVRALVSRASSYAISQVDAYFGKGTGEAVLEYLNMRDKIESDQVAKNAYDKYRSLMREGTSGDVDNIRERSQQIQQLASVISRRTGMSVDDIETFWSYDNNRTLMHRRIKRYNEAQNQWYVNNQDANEITVQTADLTPLLSDPNGVRLLKSEFSGGYAVFVSDVGTGKTGEVSGTPYQKKTGFFNRIFTSQHEVDVDGLRLRNGKSMLDYATDIQVKTLPNGRQYWITVDLNKMKQEGIRITKDAGEKATFSVFVDEKNPNGTGLGRYIAKSGMYYVMDESSKQNLRAIYDPKYRLIEQQTQQLNLLVGWNDPNGTKPIPHTFSFYSPQFQGDVRQKITPIVTDQGRKYMVQTYVGGKPLKFVDDNGNEVDFAVYDNLGKIATDNVTQLMGMQSTEMDIPDWNDPLMGFYVSGMGFGLSVPATQQTKPAQEKPKKETSSNTKEKTSKPSEVKKELTKTHTTVKVSPTKEK